jgi:hypothetical protein
MMDYREYLQQPGEWQWIEHETKRLGSSEAFYKMRTTMQLQLLQIPVGKFMSVERVQPENRNMFVKICCEWITLPLGKNYYLNNFATRIYHEHEYKNKPVIATENEENRQTVDA